MNNKLTKIKNTLETKFGWCGLNELTEIQEKLIIDVIKSIDIKYILESFEQYYHEEFGENIVNGAITDYIKHIDYDH